MNIAEHTRPLALFPDSQFLNENMSHEEDIQRKDLLKI
jgi:hypothetical protein